MELFNNYNKGYIPYIMIKNIISYDVILCTYNGASYIKDQLISIISQNFLPKSIIISDDFSQDNTIAIAKDIFIEYNFDRYIIVKGLGKGAKYNFLAALKYSESDYTFFADQDDIWLPKKIDNFHPHLVEINHPLLVFSDSRIIDKKNNIVSQSFFAYQGLSNNVFLDDSILFKNCVQGAASCINKAMRELTIKSLEIINWDNLYMHDWWVALLAKYYGKAVFIPCPLIDYRQHANNQIGAFDKNNRWKIYLKNFSSFYHNFKQAIRQNREMEKLHHNIASTLPPRNKRKYRHIPKLKWLLVKLFRL